MIRTPTEQYILADHIIEVVCNIGDVAFEDFVSPKTKNSKLNILRGLYCVITRDYCIHPIYAANLACRTRQNVINQARKYMGYLQVKDPCVTALYKNIRNQLAKYMNETK